MAREKDINRQLMQRKQETEWQLMEALTKVRPVGRRNTSQEPTAECTCRLEMSRAVGEGHRNEAGSGVGD